MDTRTKILTLEAARSISARPLALATGRFDILRAFHAAALQQAREAADASALLVVVLPSGSELLTQSARAELVAALRAVDYVVPAGPEQSSELAGWLQPAAVVHLEEDEEHWLWRLRDRVSSPLDAPSAE